MNYLKSIIVCLLIVNFSFAEVKTNFVPNQIIVQLKQQYAKKANANSINLFKVKEIESLNKLYQLKEVQPLGNGSLNIHLLTFSSNKNVEELITSYSKSDIFEFAEPNYIANGGGKKGTDITNDRHIGRQYALYNDGSFNLSPSVEDADIDIELAWEIEKGDSNIIVCILDSGAKLDHPELRNRLWKNTNEQQNNNDTDENGYKDDINGWDFVNDDNDPKDDHGHGTNVTGILGAQCNNNIGYAGVDWYSKLMICKVLDDENFGFYSWMIDAIVYAVDNGADVINMSIGGSDRSTALHNAVKYAYDNNVAIITCMMNDNNDELFYPAAFEETIAVGSTDANDERSDPFFWDDKTGSNFGEHIDVVAPGNYMYGLSYQSNTNFESYWGGTSQSAPLVTGLCALLLAQDSFRTPEDLRSIITSTAEDLVGSVDEDTRGFDIFYGHGRVNAYDALSQSVMIVSNDVSSIKSNEVRILNNPVSDNLIIENSSSEILKVSLYNLQGVLIFEKNIFAGINVVSIDTEENGLCVVRFIGADGTSKSNHKILFR